MELLIGAEHLLRIGTPLMGPCDRHDIGTTTRGRRPSVVYLHETVSGGLGALRKFWIFGLIS